MEDKQRRALIILCGVLGVILALMLGWTVFYQCVDRSGWVEKDGFVSYRDFHGKPVSGWLELEGNRYCFDNDCHLLTGWQSLEGKRYYFDQDGAMALAWQEIDGSRYYFGTDGVMQTGWLTLDGRRYYLLGNGTMATGFHEIGRSTYCFGTDGVMATGWLTLEDNTYYFAQDGTMVTGRVTLEGLHYYLQDSGVMYTGWEDTDQGRRYYDTDGAMASGWCQIQGKWYYFQEDGLTLTGWYQEGEYSYYLLEDGSAAVGPRDIDGQTYYFTPKGIMVVLVNADNPIPSYYKPEIVNYIPWHDVAAIALEPLKQMLADCTAAGYPYVFNSAYRTIKVQQDILSTRTQEYINAGMEPEEAYAEARKTVALPGTSEHNMGLAMDILNDKKADKKALDWLGQHCWEYGFILRYPPEKGSITGIVHEPWHFRYVGTEVSMDMKDSGLCLEEYLGADPVTDSTVDSDG